MKKTSSKQKTEKFISKRMIVKIGSSSIAKNGNPLNGSLMRTIARQCAILYKSGVEISIVSSGAVAAGKKLLKSTNDDIIHDQVAAIYGQNHLMNKWDRVFKKYSILTGQVLLSENDLKNPNTPIMMGLKRGVQIINANDAVNNEEMKAYFLSADNDRLAGHIAQFINADTLLLLTDVDGVLDEKGQVIKEMRENKKVKLVGKSKLGTGGMMSKVIVGFRAAKNNIRTVIANAYEKDVVLKVARGERFGTTLVA